MAAMNFPVDFGLMDGQGSFSPGQFDGLLALAPGRSQIPIIVESMNRASQLPRKIVGLQVPHAGFKGSLDFGSTKSARDVHYAPSLDNIYWTVSVDSVSIDGQSIGISDHALIDSGNPTLMMTEGDAEIFDLAIGSVGRNQQGEFIVPCSSTHRIEMTIDGNRYSIAVGDVVEEAAGDGMCKSKVNTGSYGGTGGWSLGMPFLTNVYMVMDFDINSVGLAQSNIGGRSSEEYASAAVGLNAFRDPGIVYSLPAVVTPTWLVSHFLTHF